MWLVYDEALQVGCQREPLGNPLEWEVGMRHPVTVRSALLITGSMKRVWALRHQTGAQCSAVEYTRARVAVRRTEAPAFQVVPASRLVNETLVLSFLRSDTKCLLYVRDLSSVM